MRRQWILLAAFALGACARPAIQVAAGTPIVLVSIDTLRSDHLPAYGYWGVATPALDALRRDSVLFTHAYSNMPLTFPSHTSILTGLLPPSHAVRDNEGFRLDTAHVFYLPKRLQESGYATGAAVSAYVLRRSTNLAFGFDVYDDDVGFRTGAGLGSLRRAGSETLTRASGWLQQEAARPCFLFFHIYEPHAPYPAPEPFASRYAGVPYDAAVAAADAVVGELLAELRRLGLYDRALIVLLSDHGEGLGDHGEEEHGLLLYRESLQVPLLFKLPRAQLAGRAIDSPVQLVDVAPTLLALLGQPAAPSDGVSLLPLFSGQTLERKIYSETLYPRFHFGWSDLASVVFGRFHLIEGPAPEIFDLAADPAERNNLAERERRLYADLRREAARYDRSGRPSEEADAETRRQLAALGYLGQAAAPAGPLPDPKDRLDVLRDIRDAYRLFSLKRYEEAVPAFRRVTERNPASLDAWDYLGQSLEALGQQGEALAAYQEAVRRSDGAPGPLLLAAGVLEALGRCPEAVASARLALDVEPVPAHHLLARCALDGNDLATAEREARAALAQAIAGADLAPLVTLAEVVWRQGRPEQALEITASALAEYRAQPRRDPELLHGLFFLRGRILAERGDAAAAEPSFLEEIRLFPLDSRSYTHLALLYALGGRANEVASTLERMIAAHPVAASYAEAVHTLQVLGDRRTAASLLRQARARFPEDDGLKRLAGGA